METAIIDGLPQHPLEDRTTDEDGNGVGAGEDALPGQAIDLVIDREFETLIPPLSAEEQAQLTANLQAAGCGEPLRVWARGGEGLAPVLLDGHHRYAICRAHGLPFTLAPVPSVRTRDEAKIWMLLHQFGRRNLQPYARAELALQLADLIAAQAKAQQGTRADFFQRAGTSLQPIHTDREVAKLAGVSHDTVHRVRRITQAADESVKAALRRGERSIHEVSQSLPRHSPPKGKGGAKPSKVPSPPAPPMPVELPLEPPPQQRMAARLMELTEEILQELGAWREQWPKDATVRAFGLMEKHIGELKSYFEKKQQEMGQASTAVETSQSVVGTLTGA